MKNAVVLLYPSGRSDLRVVAVHRRGAGAAVGAVRHRVLDRVGGGTHQLDVEIVEVLGGGEDGPQVVVRDHLGLIAGVDVLHLEQQVVTVAVVLDHAVVLAHVDVDDLFDALGALVLLLQPLQPARGVEEVRAHPEANGCRRTDVDALDVHLAQCFTDHVKVLLVVEFPGIGIDKLYIIHNFLQT